jgi:predicted metal-binding membrane protein
LSNQFAQLDRRSTKSQKETTAIEFLMRRDRFIVFIGLALVTVFGWVYIFDLAMKMQGMSGHGGDLMKQATEPDLMAWHLPRLLLTFIMWIVMMVAMMTPSAAPMVLQFASVYRRRHTQDSIVAASAIFLSGYFLVWMLFSGLSTLIQWRLHSAAMLSSMMVVTSRVLAGVLFIAAGVFQWTALKQACLRSCRSPMGFFLTEWREGRAGILAMGIKHGGYCLGCCFFLMAVLFAAGVMNLFWVTGIAALILLEKLSKAGPVIARVVGIGMLPWGVWLILSGF